MRDRVHLMTGLKNSGAQKSGGWKESSIALGDLGPPL